MNDKTKILEFLKDYKWHNVLAIMENVKPNCIAWAVRSRISDLKKDGYVIESEIDTNKLAKYKLVKQENSQLCFL